MPSEDIRHIFISGEDQLIKHTICGNLWASVDVFFLPSCHSDGMVGIISFLQDIALEGSDNTYKGTKYVAFFTELHSKLCALNDVNSISTYK